MDKNRYSEEILDEVLELLWTELEEGGREAIPASEIVIGSEAVEGAVLDTLQAANLVRRRGEEIILTDSGFEEARKTIRRHRLSERMFADILAVVQADMEDAACHFEHLLIKPELEERICALLGHPRTCPHGRPIPVGECCHRAETAVDQAVVPMNRLIQGQSGIIAYVHSGDSERLKKLMAMGILPGEAVTLERRYPSFVFRVGHSRYAIDEGMAEAIFVRRSAKS